MITIIQGTPGSGKSSIATVDMLEFLQSGGVVAANYALVQGWHKQLALLDLRVKWGLRDPEKLARSYFNRAFKIGTADTVFQLSEKMADIETTIKTNELGEGRGRLYLDEAQLLFNSRSWKDNMGFIEFFTQHRKLGWDVILVAHTLDMIDKQIRGLIEYETRIRNMNKVKILGMFPVSPVPMFFAITRLAGISAGAGTISHRRLYSLRKAYSSLYDSMEVFAFNESSVDVTHQGTLEETVLPGKVAENTKKTFQLNGACEPWPQYYQCSR